MSTTDAAHEFWTGNSRTTSHRELAKTFEQNIERVYPDRVTSRGMCHCLKYTRVCGHPMEGKAEYVEYNGPSL